MIVNAFCNFLQAALEYPGDVLAKMYVATRGAPPSRPGARWSAATSRAWCTPPEALTTIWVDFPQQKAMTLPDWMRALVTA